MAIFPNIAHIPIIIPKLDCDFIPLHIDVFNPNIPFLIGAEALSKFRFVDKNNH